jgi:beta-glucosidase
MHVPASGAFQPGTGTDTRFPDGFVWGAASSAYQIEGAAAEDGKGPSIWDVYSHKPGATYMEHTGDTACDHYHRYPEDIALMRRVGLHAYRFSVSWPRVLPEGTGAVNEAGLGFYERLVDGLLEAGIQPWVTLFHWDYPQALYCRGGWLSRESPEWFAEYTQVVVDRLSDRVTHWITINEPQIFLGPDHGDACGAPGMRPTTAERLVTAHHALMAHGRAARVIRDRARAHPRVGWAPIGRTKTPASDRAQDIDAARRLMLSVASRDFWNNTWFADPVCLGRYPEDGVKLFDAPMGFVRGGDMEVIRQPLDFYGVNIYDAETVEADGAGGARVLARGPGHPQTAIRWFVDPGALYWGPRFLYERYRVPIVITENGMSGIDWVALDGRVHDPQRIDYTQRSLLALRRAIADGTDIRGYFHWSIMDNCEWQQGYKERFGLIHVDFQTQTRTLKDSAIWYSRVIASHGGCLARAPEYGLHDPA